jgi:hypothetical protein
MLTVVDSYYHVGAGLNAALVTKVQQKAQQRLSRCQKNKTKATNRKKKAIA